MYLSNTITFSQDFQISPLQNIFYAQPRVSEEILLSVLFKSNIWWSSKQVLWCVSGFYFGWRPRLRMKPCRQSTIAKSPGKEEKCLVEVAARAAARTARLMPLQKVQMLLSQGTEEQEAALTSGRDTAKVTHCRKGFTENLLLWDCVCVNIEFIQQQQHISCIYSTFNKSMKDSNTVPAGEKRNPLNTYRDMGIWLVKQSSTQRIKVSEMKTPATSQPQNHECA